MRIVTKDYNLLKIFPGIAKQWHPTKNGNLKPDQVTPHSGKVAWWICDKGHVYKTIIASRSSGTGCFKCNHSGPKASPQNNLAVKFSELAKQWHPTKNGDLKPNQVMPKSSKKAWWICDKGHIWEAKVSSRGNGSGCPFCSGYFASSQYNLFKLFPEIAKQWHPTKNGDLKPDQVTPHSGKKAWWQCNKGHIYNTIIASRSSGNGCPFCSGLFVSLENNLLVKFPGIAKQWHPIKNCNLKPNQVTPKSSKKVWWLCSKGHEWKSKVANMSKENGCPFCGGRKASPQYNLTVKFPELAKQWHPKKNGNLKPEQVTPHSSKKAWWLCSKGHEWLAVVADRSDGTGCPFCIGHFVSPDYNLASKLPDLAKEWHPTKNSDLKPDQVTPGSRRKVWWICDKGHEWPAVIANRSKENGTGCPFCKNK